MSRSVTTYAVLLLAALVGAYLTWTHEPTTQVSEGVVIAEIDPDDLERITYTTAKKELIITARSDDDEDRYWWVEETRQVEPESSDETPPSPPDTRSSGEADAGSPDANAADDRPDTGGEPESPSDNEAVTSSDPPELKTEHEVYRASSVFDRFIDNIGSLRARRKLPEPDADRRRTYGFDGATKELVITTADGSRTFTIGSHTYGRQHVYLRDDASGDFYVVDASVIGPFKFSETRLKEKRVMRSGEQDLASIVFESEGRSARLNRQDGNGESTSDWSFADGGDSDQTAQVWVDKLLRVQIDEYLEDNRPADLTSRLVGTLESNDGETTSVEFFERESGDTIRYFARSNYAKGFVELEQESASILLSDLSPVFEASGE